jgi:hypothetical protein
LRRLATTLDALAFLWACGATVYLLVAISPTGIATSAMLAPSLGEATRMPPSLATANGVWMAGLLVGVTMLAGMPLGIAWAHPSGHRMTAWTAASLLLGFCLLSGLFVGLLYLPCTFLLMAAGAVSRVEARRMPLADSRA